MRTPIIALRLYRWGRLSGLLSTPFGQACFEWCYDRYKSWLEAGDIRLLRPFVPPGASVVDVGANIGFFTTRFARWVGHGGRVLAIEPEEANFERLVRRLHRRGLERSVEPIRAAACEADGEVKLRVDPFHPAGHRLSDEGVSVRALTLDSLLSARNWPPVGLIKIDVQGAEERVLRGAQETLSRCRPALFVEVDPEALAVMGFGVGSLLEFLAQHGYAPHRLQRGGPRPVPSRRDIEACLRYRYTDFLFLRASSPRPSRPVEERERPPWATVVPGGMRYGAVVVGLSRLLLILNWPWMEA